jgi:hypothetical protein
MGAAQRKEKTLKAATRKEIEYRFAGAIKMGHADGVALVET